MAMRMIGGMVGVFSGACYLEKLFSNLVLAKYLPALVAPSPMLGGVVTTLYGGARSKFMEKAKKNGDEHAEERFSLPKLYAEGFTQEAKEFNCHQRAHQQALETYTSFVVCSLIGGVRQPLLTTVAGVVYIIARLKWAKGYTTGDPMNRYKKSDGWGFHIWTSLLCTFACAAATGLGVAGIA